MNSNKTAKMLDIIQAKRGITLGEVAELIGRSRAYLSQAKARPDSFFLIRLLEEHFADELKGGEFEETKSPAPDPVTMLQDQVQDLRKHNDQLTKINDSLLNQMQVNFGIVNVSLAKVEDSLNAQFQMAKNSQLLQVLIAAGGDVQKENDLLSKMGKLHDVGNPKRKGNGKKADHN